MYLLKNIDQIRVKWNKNWRRKSIDLNPKFKAKLIRQLPSTSTLKGAHLSRRKRLHSRSIPQYSTPETPWTQPVAYSLHRELEFTPFLSREWPFSQLLPELTFGTFSAVWPKWTFSDDTFRFKLNSSSVA